MPATRMLWLALSDTLLRPGLAARAERPCTIDRPPSKDAPPSDPDHAAPRGMPVVQIGRLRHPYQHTPVCIDGVSPYRTVPGHGSAQRFL